MRHDSNPRSMDVNLRRLVLISAFRLGMTWDLLTTFLGSIIILGSVGFVVVGLGLVGAFTVWTFNFSTQAIWKPRRITRIQVALLQFTWLFAIAYDFWTSLTCNIHYVALKQVNLGQSEAIIPLFSQLTIGQALIVLFVTILTTVSPMMVDYIRGQNSDVLI